MSLCKTETALVCSTYSSFKTLWIGGFGLKDKRFDGDITHRSGTSFAIFARKIRSCVHLASGHTEGGFSWHVWGFVSYVKLEVTHGELLVSRRRQVPHSLLNLPLISVF